VVAVSRDQCQCFGSSILLDTSTAHDDQPFRGARQIPWPLPVLKSIRRPLLRQILGGDFLRIFPLAAILLVPGLLLDAGPIVRQHTIGLTGEAASGLYRFTPERLTANPGDTLSFQVRSGGPHALGVDPTGLPETVRDAWNMALPRRTGSLRGPLLRAGQTYSVVVPRTMAAGKYVFFCLAHRAYDMKLEVDVKR
jgi:plastocyanin